MEQIPRKQKNIVTDFMIFVKHRGAELRPNGREVNCQMRERQVKRIKHLLSGCM